MNLQNKKYYYKVYGLEIESDIEIKELVSVEHISENKVVIVKKEMPAEIKQTIRNNIYSEFSKNELWFCVKDIAIYRVSNGNTIEFEPCENADPYLLRVFLTCSCLGFIMIQRDIIAIHGGTIVIDDKAVILTGERGAGKSTLTTALRLKGYKFISDDVAAVEVKEYPMVKHGFPYQKICDSAMEKLGYDKQKYSSFMSDKEIKYLVPAFDDFIYEDTKLYAICEIAVGDVEEVQVEEVKGSKKLQKVITNRYRGEFIEVLGGITPNAFKTLLDIAKQIKVYKITRPKDQFTVDEQIGLLEEKLQEVQYV